MLLKRGKHVRFSLRQKSSKRSLKRVLIFAVTALLIAVPAVVFTINKRRAAALPCPCSLHPTNPTPQGTDNNAGSLEVGFKFKSAINGYVTGVRFFKTGSDMGTSHTGSLWDNMGNESRPPHLVAKPPSRVIITIRLALTIP